MRRWVIGISCGFALISCAVKTPDSSANVPLGVVPTSNAAALNPSPIPSFPAKPEPPSDAEKKLDGTLLKVVHASNRGGEQQAEATAKSLSIIGGDNRIKIDVALTDKSNVPAFLDAIRAMGAKVSVSFENHVFVYVQPVALKPIAARADVFSLAVASSSVHQ